MFLSIGAIPSKYLEIYCSFLVKREQIIKTITSITLNGPSKKSRRKNR